jgi:uncharacterized protein (DUF2344 family)
LHYSLDNYATSEPPPGLVATWREIDDTQSEGIDADSTSSEEEYEQSEYFFKLALEQYDQMIAQDPTNMKLIERRTVLLQSTQNQNKQDSAPNKMDQD